jgi:hypothetical protein
METSQDCAQKPQGNCTFMNSASAQTQSTHRVANATSWRTFHHDGMVRVGVHAAPLSLYLQYTITYKVVVYAPAEWADILTLFLHYPYMYSVVSSSTPPHSAYVIHNAKIYVF